MAFAASTEWDVRTTGSSSNGGGFDTGSTGTDFSIQDNPQVTYTDLVIDGTTNTKCTSSAHPFDSTHVGNIINITSGTGFTVQRVQVVSVVGSTATCDKSLGTLSSTGGNGKLGGGVDDINTIKSILANYNVVHVKSGTYTYSATVTLVGSGAVNVKFIGYQTTHRDALARPLLTTATNSVNLLTLAGGCCNWFENISFSHTAGTRGKCILPGNAQWVALKDCIFDGFTTVVMADNSGSGYGPIFANNCEFKNCQSDVLTSVRSIQCNDCLFRDNTGGAGVKVANGPPYCTINRCTFKGNTYGINTDGNVNGGANVCVFNSNFYSQTGDAIIDAGPAGATVTLWIENCVFYGSSGWAINLSTATSSNNQDGFNLIRNNAFGSNSSGNVRRMQTYEVFGSVTLTADPFTNAGTLDFSLNNTAGGGAACRNAGFQRT